MPTQRKFQRKRKANQEPKAEDEPIDKPFFVNPLPGQKPIKNHDLQLKQERIFILGFSKDLESFEAFPKDKFKDDLIKFVNSKGFFSRHNKNKRQRNSAHVVDSVIPSAYAVFATRYIGMIRPTIHPETNIHCIQQIFNEAVFQKGYSSFWCREEDFEKMKDDDHMLKLSLKVMDYEFERRRMWENREMPVFRSVYEYRHIMVEFWGTSLGVIVKVGVDRFVKEERL